MKKTLILITAIFAFFTHNAFAQENICNHVNIDWLKTHVPLPNESKIIHKKNRFDICEIVLDINGQVAPLYAGKNYIIAGQMMQEKHQVTGEVLQSLEPVIKKNQEELIRQQEKIEKARLEKIKNNFSVIENMVAISTDKNAEKKVYVVTDPLCGYCTKTLNFLKPLAKEKGFSIEVIIYPIFGEQSAPLVNKAITDNFTIDEYIDSAWKSKKYNDMEKSEKFEKINKLGQDNFTDFNFDGVPVILGDKASFMVIGADLVKIEEQINLLY
jgi:thiol:disulfide interchange protein DsbC